MALGNGERYYSPAYARFIQQDSVIGKNQSPQSLNRYSYVSNNPLKYTDPSGNEGLLADSGKSAINSLKKSTNNQYAQSAIGFMDVALGSTYDAVNFITLGQFGKKDRVIQKITNGEVPSFFDMSMTSDLLNTNWYGGKQNGWNPGNFAAHEVIGIATASIKLLAGTIEMANSVTPVETSKRLISFLSDPIGETEKQRQTAISIVTGVKQKWGNAKGYADLAWNDPNKAIDSLVNAGLKAGPEETGKAFGEGIFNTVMSFEGVGSFIKWSKSLSKRAKPIPPTREFIGDSGLFQNKVAGNIRAIADDILADISNKITMPNEIWKEVNMTNQMQATRVRNTKASINIINSADVSQILKDYSKILSKNFGLNDLKLVATAKERNLSVVTTNKKLVTQISSHKDRKSLFGGVNIHVVDVDILKATDLRDLIP